QTPSLQFHPEEVFFFPRQAQYAGRRHGGQTGPGGVRVDDVQGKAAVEIGRGIDDHGGRGAGLSVHQARQQNRREEGRQVSQGRCQRFIPGFVVWGAAYTPSQSKATGAEGGPGRPLTSGTGAPRGTVAALLGTEPL